MNNIVITDTPLDIAPKSNSTSEKDYSKLLDLYNLEYKKDGYYWQVGEIDWIQGWIIDISVIPLQFPELFHKILPLLIYEKLAFKVVRNAKIAKSIAGGELGYLLLGKLFSIYPADEAQALKIAKDLIGLTASLRGPRILTDRHLGSLIYTRYGVCNPIIRIDESGRDEKCMYDSKGELVKDPYSIPFLLPEAINWPFSTLATARSPKPETVLQDKYKPMKLLKEDTKGSVRKGLFLEKWYRIKWCVIKEGKENMIADDQGRDAADRLRWQFELHRTLKGVVPLPAIYDLFTENGDTYLVMEYIKGPSLNTMISRIFEGRLWEALSLADRLRLIDYGSQVLEIIERMHAKGFLHRDITPVNFLVSRNDRLYMIDLELSYSEDVQKPFPPFRLGTSGFMSPEQEVNSIPTVKQDIYALGALLLNLLTSLSPTKFATENKDLLVEQLFFLLPDRNLITLFSNCFDAKPQARPTLFELKEVLKQFQKKQTIIDSSKPYRPVFIPPNTQILKTAVEQALHALSGKKMMNADHLWISKTVQEPEFVYPQMESVSVYPDLSKGLSGVIWLLARARKMGFSVNACWEAIEKSRAFIRENGSLRLAELPSGLYYGTAGMTLALVEGVENGLIPDEEQVREEIRSYLLQEKSQELGIVKGVSGQGMAILKAKSLLGEAFVIPLLQQKLEVLLSKQQKDGSWIYQPYNNKTAVKLTGYGHGVAGIILFLLEYCKQFKDQDTNLVKQAASKALGWLTRQSIKNSQQTIWYLHDKTKLSSPGLQEGFAGVALSLIKAYELFGEPEYRRLAEACLGSYPSYSTCSDITLSNGLVGYGETCIEAASAFQSGDWQDRADWIAQFLLHYFQEQKDGSRYWLLDGTFPTAGLMEGNSGVIHFLLRCYKPGKLNHPLLIQ